MSVPLIQKQIVSLICLSFLVQNQFGSHTKKYLYMSLGRLGCLVLQLHDTAVSWYALCTLLHIMVISTNVCEWLPFCIRGESRSCHHLCFFVFRTSTPQTERAPFQTQGARSRASLFLMGKGLTPPDLGSLDPLYVDFASHKVCLWLQMRRYCLRALYRELAPKGNPSQIIASTYVVLTLCCQNTCLYWLI